MKLFAALVVAVCASSVAAALYENFEDESLVLGSKEMCCSHSFTRQTSIVRAGKYAGRFEIHKGDKMVSGGARSEFRRGLSLPNREAWTGFSFYAPSILAQRHFLRFMQYWSGQSGASGMVTIGFTPNATMAIECRWGSNQSSDNQGFHPKYRSNAWNDLVIHVKWPASNGAKGLIQLWINGAKVVDYTPSGTATGLPTTHKFGIYSSEGDFADYTTQTAKVDAWLIDDEIRFVEGPSSYDSVKPTGSSTATGPLTPAMASTLPQQYRLLPSLVRNTPKAGTETAYRFDGRRLVRANIAQPAGVLLLEGAK